MIMRNVTRVTLVALAIVFVGVVVPLAMITGFWWLLGKVKDKVVKLGEKFTISPK